MPDLVTRIQDFLERNPDDIVEARILLREAVIELRRWQVLAAPVWPEGTSDDE